MSLRSNFGAELRIGNGPGRTGRGENIYIPRKMFTRCGATAQMGEIAYVAEREREAVDFIREDYPRFMVLCLKRFIYYWGWSSAIVGDSGAGSAQEFCFPGFVGAGLLGPGTRLAQAPPGAWLFFWLILSYPAVYYAVFPHPRYRHPIEPELGILMVYVISEAQKKNATKKQTSTPTDGGPICRN